MKDTTATQQVTGAGNTIGSSLAPWSIHMWCCMAIAILGAIVFSASLGNGFTNWDDTGYILNNPLLRDTSIAGIRAMIFEPVMGNYHPVTILLYAAEYALFGFDPFYYHFNSLALHIIVSCLAYWLAYLLSSSWRAALVTGLLFVSHPMHVESVAWAAGRKDVLMALFYFLSCIFYWYYCFRTNSRKWLFYLLSIVCFLLAVLSKPVAVFLPISLLLVDFLKGREMKPNLWLDKVLYFAFALVLGVVAYRIQHSGGAMATQQVDVAFWQRIVLAFYALGTYLAKVIVPVSLRCLYTYPVAASGELLNTVYVGAGLCLLCIGLLVMLARRNRMVVFGSLFFLANIAILLQLLPIGDAIVAERYAYLPYFGLFLVIGSSTGQLLLLPARKMVLAAGISLLALFGWLSHQRCQVWIDSATLWRDVMRKEPERGAVAYNNLGYLYFDKMNLTPNPVERTAYQDTAIALFTQAIKINGRLMNALQGMGILSYMKGELPTSAWYFREVLAVNPSADAHTDYANILDITGKTDSALLHYTLAIAARPLNHLPYLARGGIYRRREKWPEAYADFTTAIQLFPDVAAPYYYRSFCDTQMQDKKQAIADVNTALSLGFREADTAYLAWLQR